MLIGMGNSLMKKITALIVVGILAYRVPAVNYYVNVSNSIPVTPFADWLTAATNIQDAIDVATNGDVVIVTDGIYQAGGRVVSSDLTNRVVINKVVTVRSLNGPAVTMILGNSVLGSNAVRCVYMTNNSVLSGFTVTNGGTSMLDTSGGGIYADGSSLAVVTNCVLIGNSAVGLGGGAYNATLYNSSIVQNSAYGGGGLNCSGSVKSAANCLIWSNSATANGGGAQFYSLNNCVVSQNTASFGGGGANSWLYGCLVVSNSAPVSGGGLYTPSTVVNCTIAGNTALQGGGIDGGSPTVQNSIIFNNTAASGSHPNFSSGTFFNCCTTPMPGNHFSTITNDPGFVNYATGDFHLRSDSPCINGGRNSYISAFITTDLDSSPRIVDGFVDIGAYEYQTPASILPYYFAQQYGLPLDGTIDSDGDGMNNWQECFAGTNPTNTASVIKMLSVSNNVSGKVVTWQSVANRIYYLQRSTNLLAYPAFVSIYTNSAAALTNLNFTDTKAPKGASCFYRVSVQ